MSKVLRRYSRRLESAKGTEWYLVSRQGALLFYVAANPGCSIDDASAALRLRRSTVWEIGSDLRGLDLVKVRRERGKNRYTVNPEARISLPGLNGVELACLVSGITPARLG